ncbi:hypothetical protein R1sor_015907 [Riccia sorocarpa]|uniref:Uncharacterized protein n=1 Tax=Riccia sorocarpa TaxID=122646 RepID=A0ABD3HDI3_9MARC
MEGVNYMDGSDTEETIFNPGEMTLRRQQDASVLAKCLRPSTNLSYAWIVVHATSEKKSGVKGGCGEKDRYDAAQMVRFTHADSDRDDLDEEDIEGDEEDCDDDPKKGVGKPHLVGRGVNGE